MQFEVLVYPMKDDQVLMIHKKRGLGKGLINGAGGKIEKNESPEDAAIRELEEETGLKAKSLEFMGVLEFIDNNSLYSHCYVFITKDFDGEILETEEAKPFWVNINEIPFDKMWEDDIFWFPLVLEGKKIFGRFWFKDWKLDKYELHELKFVEELK